MMHAVDDFQVQDNPRSSDIQSQPHNRQAEEAVLGAVLINPESFGEVSQVLDAEHFYIIRNRWIWEAFGYLYERRLPIDLLTVSEELTRQERLEEAGGQSYLMALINQTPSSLNAQAYAQIVEETAVRRRMLTAANEMAKLAYDQEQSVVGILDAAEKTVFGLSEKRAKRDVEPIKEVISSYYDRVLTLSQKDEEFTGVRTGMIDLDKLLGGMQKSDLLIIAGRPASGKTGFLLSVAKNAAQIYRKHVAIFSLEMSSEQLVQRFIAQETGINTQRLRSGKLETDEWNVFTQAIEVLSDTQIFLDDTPALSPLALRTKCRRLHLEYHLDLILVDYLQLMSSESRTENRVQEVSFISRSLKTLARELDVPVLAAAQLSRAVEQRTDKMPQLSDLRESGSLEQDSDVVMFIHRPDALAKEQEKRALAEIIVAKHRNGPTHSGIQMVFMNDIARFENAALMPDEGFHGNAR